jgi:hypothetical protein
MTPGSFIGDRISAIATSVKSRHRDHLSYDGRFWRKAAVP